MICGSEVVGDIHFDQGVECAFARWKSRFSLKDGEKSQGDHIFSLRLFILASANLLNVRPKEEVLRYTESKILKRMRTHI